MTITICTQLKQQRWTTKDLSMSVKKETGITIEYVFLSELRIYL